MPRETGGPRLEAEKRREKAKEEYRANVEKYEEVRSKFTTAMEASAGRFQALIRSPHPLP